MPENYLWMITFALLLAAGLPGKIRFRKKQEELKKKHSGKQVPKIEDYMTELREYFDTMLSRKSKKGVLQEEISNGQELLRKELKLALGHCSQGDLRAKLYVKEHMKQWLVDHRRINETELEQLIPFTEPEQLNAKDKFDILLFYYKKEAGSAGFREMMQELPKEITKSGRITEHDLDFIYFQKHPVLSFPDKLEIVVQRIYEQFLGLGIIDELRDMELDGLSCGVSGGELTQIQIPKEQHKRNSSGTEVWIFFRGAMTALEFLRVPTERELERIARKVYRYGHPGQLSARKGYMVSQMQDGSRVVVVRPPFAEGWSFFIRKFLPEKAYSLRELFGEAQVGVILLYELLECLIVGEQVCAVTGEQGAGKTTLLKTLISFIPVQYTLRTQELVFELHLRQLYPERNIVSFCETGEVSGREGLDLQKKTDGSVLIIGEVASAPVSGWLVMAAQTASRFTLFTHHAKTAKSLINAMRNDLLTAGGFQNETAAELQVREAVRFDIHLAKGINGERYVERITEINRNKSDMNTERELLCKNENGYQKLAEISFETSQEMRKKLNAEQQNRFSAWLSEKA